MIGELQTFRGSPTWALFCHVSSAGNVDEEQFLLYRLDGIGVKRAMTPSAAAHLYDLQRSGPVSTISADRRREDDSFQVPKRAVSENRCLLGLADGGPK